MSENISQKDSFIDSRKNFGYFIISISVILLSTCLLLHYIIYKTVLGSHIYELAKAFKDAIVFTIFIWTSCVLGLRLLSRFDIPFTSYAYRLIVSSGIGFTFYSLLGLTISLLQVLTAPLLAATLLIPLLILRKESIDIFEYISKKLYSIRKIGLGSTFLFLLFSLYLAVSISPPRYIDPLTYHLMIPKSYLLNGGIPSKTTTVMSYFPPAMSMLYMYLMGLGSDLLPKVLHWYFFILITGVLFFNVRYLVSKKTAYYSTILFSCQWVVQHGIQRANIDFHFTFYSLLSLFIILNAFCNKNMCRFQKNWAILSGVFFGTAILSKYTAINVVFGLEFLLLVLYYKKRVELKNVIIFNLCAFSIFLPCMVRNYIYTGDPLFWFLSNPLKLFHVIPEEMFKYMSETKGLVIPKLSIHLFFMMPFYMYFDGKFPTTNFDGFIDPFYMVSIFLGIFLLKKYKFIIPIYTFIFLYYCSWIVTYPQTRYALPVIPILCFITILTFEIILEKTVKEFSYYFEKMFYLIIIIFCFFSTLQFSIIYCRDIGFNIPGFLRTIDRNTYLGVTNFDTMLRIEEFLVNYENRETQKKIKRDNKIFMVYANQPYYIKREVFNDSIYSNIGFLKSKHKSGNNPVDWLKENGYRYLLFDYGRIVWYVNSGRTNQRLNPSTEALKKLYLYLDFFKYSIEPNLKKMKQFGGLTLYEVPD